MNTWIQFYICVQRTINLFTQIYLTSSKKVMGEYKNTLLENIMLWIILGVVTVLNIMLLISYI